MKAVKKGLQLNCRSFSSYRHHPNPRQILISRCFQLAEARSGLEFLVLLQYTLQMVGQKNMNPTVASLILSLESVISVIAGFLVLHQNLSQRELIGCALMFIAIILAQLPGEN